MGKKENESTKKEYWTHSACSMSTTCPLKIKVRDGKIVEVKGEDVPGWDGATCGKAIAGIQDRIYAKDRTLTPLKRVGKRGEGKFVECTWDEVIDALATKLKQYKKEGHPEAFEIWWGCPFQQDSIDFLYYWSVIVGSGISYLHGQVCNGDNMVEKNVTFGKNHSQTMLSILADWPRTKYTVIAGQNFPGTGQVHGGPCNIPTYALVNDARENGCKFVIIDPKLTDTGAWCDEWIPIEPGKDQVFALSVTNVLISEKLYDGEFLLKYTNAAQLIRTDTRECLSDDKGNYLVWNDLKQGTQSLPKAGKMDGLSLGHNKTYYTILKGKKIECKTAFQIFAEMVKEYSPSKFSFKDQAIKIARNLGKNKPSVVFSSGFTSGRYPNWFQTMRAFSIVNLLLGNFDKPGGYYFIKNEFNISNGWPVPPEVPDYSKDKKLVPAPYNNMTLEYNIDQKPCYLKPRKYHPAVASLPWLHFQAMGEGKVKAILSTTENSILTQQNTKWVRECLNKLDLIIVGDQFLKEFSDWADYVIPEASFLERNHLYYNKYISSDSMENLLLYMRSAAIPPEGNSKPLSWFLIQVAKKIGLENYVKNIDLQYKWWDKMLEKAKLFSKVSSKKLIEEGPYFERYPLSYNLLFKPIETRSGRFEIYSNELAEECYYNPKSKWYQNEHVNPFPVEIKIAQPENENEFFLICGKASWHQKSATQHSNYLMEYALEAGCPYIPVYINSTRAKELGFSDGEEVILECVGPRKDQDQCVINDDSIGYKDKAIIKTTEGLHPKALWIYWASGHEEKSNTMASKTKKGVKMNWFLPTSATPYSAGVGKNYSIVKINNIKG